MFENPIFWFRSYMVQTILRRKGSLTFRIFPQNDTSYSPAPAGKIPSIQCITLPSSCLCARSLARPRFNFTQIKLPALLLLLLRTLSLALHTHTMCIDQISTQVRSIHLNRHQNGTHHDVTTTRTKIRHIPLQEPVSDRASDDEIIETGLPFYQYKTFNLKLRRISSHGSKQS